MNYIIYLNNSHDKSYKLRLKNISPNLIQTTQQVQFDWPWATPKHIISKFFKAFFFFFCQKNID